MKSVLEYIMLNYTWFLVGAIIILLAIIGSYADKTNFGQGKQKEEKDEDSIKDNIDKKALENKRMEDMIEVSKHDAPVSEKTISVTSMPLDTNVQSQNTVSLNNNGISQNIESINTEIKALENSEEKFEKFEKEFNELLPKKEIINDELLDEIDNLSLDKTQKIDLSDIPDLDDVELPKIKSLQPEEEDIWKF